MFNKYWFRRFYTGPFLEVINYYAESLRTKIVPAFTSISEEADKVAAEAFEALGQSVDPENYDPGDYADAASEAGIEFGIMAWGVRQGVINMFTAGLYHLFEQQLLKLHRHDLLTMNERRPPISPGLLTTELAKQRLLDRGIDITRFKSWSKIKELSLVANTVKHADGRSCDQLKNLRPDLFGATGQIPGLPVDLTYHQVLQPLAGEDLYVSEAEFLQYVDEVKQFWDELAAAVEALPA